MENIRLWFDDVREPKLIGWTWAKSVEQAKEVLSEGYVVEASLDHDITGEGSNPPNGNDLVRWMINNLPPTKWPSKIIIHSHNSAGTELMLSKLMNCAPKFTEIVIERYRKD